MTRDTTSTSLLIDLDNPAPSPRCIINEVISNRAEYIGDDAASVITISRFPSLLLESLATLESILDDRIGYNSGVGLIAVVAMSEGHTLLVHDHRVRKLFDARRKYYSLDRRPVDKYLKREFGDIVNRWKFFVKGDEYGGSRKNFYNIPTDLAREIHTSYEKLGINKGEVASLCIAKCMTEQEQLSRELRHEVEKLIQGFDVRVGYRLAMLEWVLEWLTKTGTRKERLKRSRRTRRTRRR